MAIYPAFLAAPLLPIPFSSPSAPREKKWRIEPEEGGRRRKQLGPPPPLLPPFVFRFPDLLPPSPLPPTFGCLSSAASHLSPNSIGENMDDGVPTYVCSTHVSTYTH